MLALLIGLWVAMSELLQGVQGTYPKPFAITWVIHVGYSLMLIPGFSLTALRHRRAPANASWWNTLDSFNVPFMQIFWLTLLLNFVCCGIAYTWYYSLPRTTVAANNAIYQSASVFVYLFSFLLLGERLTLQKAAAVAVSVGGVALVSFAKNSTDDSDIHPSTAGYMMVVASTCLYALYEVMYAKYAEGHAEEGDGDTAKGGGGSGRRASEQEARGDGRLSDGDRSEEPLLGDSGLEAKAGASGSLNRGRGGGGPDDLPRNAWRASEKGKAGSAATAEQQKQQDAESAKVWLQLELSFLVLGLIGAWSILTLWPLFFLLDATGLEPFRLPSRGVLEILLGNVALDSAYNSLLLFGIALAGPLPMSVGCMLVVPASIVADYFLHHTLLTPMAVCGVILIVAGFVLLKLTAGCLAAAASACGLAAADGAGGDRSPPGPLEARGEGVGRSDSGWDGLSMAGVHERAESGKVDDEHVLASPALSARGGGDGVFAADEPEV